MARMTTGRGKRVAMMAAVLCVAVTAVGTTLVLRAAGSYRERLIGKWQYEEGGLPHAPLGFPCWIFHRDGQWGISDDFEYYPAGEYKLLFRRLTLQEREDFSHERRHSEHTIRFVDDDTLIIDSGHGAESRWKRRTAPLTPAVMYPPRGGGDG